MSSTDQFKALADKQIAALESLAREVSAPVEEVAALYRIEHARLESTAKIKTYVPVFANRRVRTLFEIQHHHAEEHSRA